MSAFHALELMSQVDEHGNPLYRRQTPLSDMDQPAADPRLDVPRETNSPADNTSSGSGGSNEDNEEDEQMSDGDEAENSEAANDTEVKEDIDDDTANTSAHFFTSSKLRAIRARPEVRPLEAHPRYGILRDSRSEYVMANAVYTRGTEADPPCNECELAFGASNRKPAHPKCVVMDGELHGSCTNCHYRTKKTCSFRSEFFTSPKDILIKIVFVFVKKYHHTLTITFHFGTVPDPTPTTLPVGQKRKQGVIVLDDDDENAEAAEAGDKEEKTREEKIKRLRRDLEFFTRKSVETVEELKELGAL